MPDEKTQTIELGSVWVPTDFKELSNDVVRLSDRDLRKQAAEDAEAGNPPIKQDDQYGVQALIMDHVNEKCDRLTDFFNDGVTAATRAMRKLVIVPISSAADDKIVGAKLSNHKDMMKGSFERSKNDLSADLLQSNEDSLQATTTFRRFKLDNELEHDAQYPISTLFVKATIVVALLFEAIFNAFLFQNVMPGYLAGAAIALIFSGLNIAFGFIAGWAGWRNIIHIKSVRKLIGWSITLIATIIGLGWNLFVAHFRELAAVAETGAYKKAAAHMFANPFGIDSIEAYALLLIGVLIFFIIAYEGYCKLDDPYLGYGKKDRLKRASRRVLEDKRQILRHHIEDIANERRELIEDLQEEELAKLKRAQSTIDTIKSFKADILNSINRQSITANKKLRVYREANMKVRGGVIPNCFAHYADPTTYIHDSMDSEEEAYDLQASIKEAYENNRPLLDRQLSAIIGYEAELLQDAEEWFLEVEKKAERRRGQSDSGPESDDTDVSTQTVES